MNEKLRDEPTIDVLNAAELTAVEGGIAGPGPQFPPYGGCIPRPGFPFPRQPLPPLKPVGTFPA